MECLWSDCVPTDILRSILSRLVAGEYFAFRAVCKRWRLIEPPIHDSAAPFDNGNTPCLMTLDEEKGILDCFHPVYNAPIYKIDTPELKGCRIRCSKYGWLLMSRDRHSVFFFNPFSKVKIELPDQDRINSCPYWTFSCPPDSSDCFVIGLDMLGCPWLYIIKVGESTWTDHFFDKVRFTSTGCNNLVFLKNNIYVLGDKGNLAILSIKKTTAETPTWKICRKPFPRRKGYSIRQIRMIEDDDDGGLLVAVRTSKKVKEAKEIEAMEVWRYTYNMNQRVLEREPITNLGNKTLFVGWGASFLKPCVAQGLGNKIFVPMFHDNKGTFYSLASGNYYSFDYYGNKAFSSQNCFNMVQPRSYIWIEPNVSHVPINL